MSNFLYELWRTLKSRTLLAMIILVVMSSFFVAFVASDPPSLSVVGKRVLGGYIFASTDNLFGLLIPLVAIFEGYVVYGKDRLNGVLDSVVIKPITKQNVLAARFMACLISVLVGLSVSVVIIDYYLVSHGFSALSSDLFISIVLAYAVDASAFIGFVFLISHLSRSQTMLLGLSMSLFFMLDMLWTSIMTSAIMQFGHAYPFSTSEFTFLRYYVILSYASPVSFVDNVAFLVTWSPFAPGLITFQMGPLFLDPSKFGVTLPLVSSIGLVWALVPILVGWLFARRYD